MPTLWRYVATRFLWSFLGSIVILALVVLVVDMLLSLDEILEGQDSVWGALRFLLTRSATLYLPYLIPVAAFTGAFVSVGQAARVNEIVAIRAGGVAPLQALIPVFALALIIAAFAGVLNETVSVRSAAALGEALGRDPGGVTVNEGGVWYHSGDIIYHVRGSDDSSEEVRDILVFERNPAGRLVRKIHAETAERIAPQLWRFRRATVRSFDPDRPSAPPVLERADEITLELAQDRSPRLTKEELASLSLATLFRHVTAISQSGGHPGRARSVLHARLTGPFLVLILAVLAVPLALRVERTRSLALPALQGVAILFLLVLAREYGGNFAARGVLASAWVPWLVIAAFFGFGSWQLSRIPQ